MKNFKIVKPMVWGEPENKDDCYFCMTPTKGYNSSNLHTIKYANVSSVIKSIIVSTENSDEDDICSSLNDDMRWTLMKQLEKMKEHIVKVKINIFHKERKMID